MALHYVTYYPLLLLLTSAVLRHESDAPLSPALPNTAAHFRRGEAPNHWNGRGNSVLDLKGLTFE